MSYMFDQWTSLNELNIDNFNTNKVVNMSFIFYGCSDELINKIKKLTKNQFRNL